MDIEAIELREQYRRSCGCLSNPPRWGHLSRKELLEMPPSASMATAAKRRGGMTRQHSLQGSIPSNKRGLSRQMSDDPVHITGQGWGSEKPESSLRIGEDTGRNTPPRHVTRPKPVKLAWGERRQDSTESLPGEGVEVVARRCAGLPRPVARMPRTSNLTLPGEKDSIVLTRQQLAERLRRAWRDRDQKSNLDIFLAHSRPESAISARSVVSEVAGDTPKTTARPLRATVRPKLLKTSNIKETSEDEVKVEKCTSPDDGAISNKNPALMDLLEFKMFPVADLAKKYGSDYSSKQFQLKNSTLTKRYSFDEPDNKENVCDDSSDNKRDVITVNLSATARRESFKSSQLLHKTIADSFSVDDPGGSSSSKATPSAAPRPPLVRTSSAPTQRTIQPPSPIHKVIKFNKLPPEKKTIVQMEVNGNQESERDNRARLSAGRRKNKQSTRKKHRERESDSSEDEERVDFGHKRTARRRPMSGGGGGDIVTMVSLVSPAESESEEPLVTPTVASWSGKENEETLVTETDQGDKDIAALILQKCVSLRKTTKTVSFSTHPSISRSCSASFPSRRAPPGASIIIPTSSLISSSASQGEKKPSQDRGVKRRLVRSRTAPSKQDEDNGSSDDNSKTDTSTEAITNQVLTPVTFNDEIGDHPENEPELKSPKERECWALYKRMVEKGVAVSYETVLRGMLTPTEYRLRKNQHPRC